MLISAFFTTVKILKQPEIRIKDQLKKINNHSKSIL